MIISSAASDKKNYATFCHDVSEWFVCWVYAVIDSKWHNNDFFRYECKLLIAIYKLTKYMHKGAPLTQIYKVFAFHTIIIITSQYNYLIWTLFDFLFSRECNKSYIVYPCSGTLFKFRKWKPNADCNILWIRRDNPVWVKRRQYAMVLTPVWNLRSSNTVSASTHIKVRTLFLPLCHNG